MPIYWIKIIKSRIYVDIRRSMHSNVKAQIILKASINPIQNSNLIKFHLGRGWFPIDGQGKLKLFLVLVK